VKLLLVADGDRFLGTLAPGDLPATGTIEPGIVPDPPSLRPGDSIPRALELLEHTSRVPVVDADGRLHGLVCLNRGKSAFCATPLRSR
jgi:CBS domain-containing protein